MALDNRYTFLVFSICQSAIFLLNAFSQVTAMVCQYGKPIPFGHMILLTYAVLSKIRPEVFLSQSTIYTFAHAHKSIVNSIIT